MAGIIMLALDGEAVPLKNLQVTPSLQIQDKEQGGQTSSTARAEQGIKPKQLQITGLIDYSNDTALTRIFALAEAQDSAGKQHVYRIANATAAAMNFREGVFSGNVSATPQGDKMCWQISFSLKEQNSVAEKREARTKQKAGEKTQTQNADGTTTPAPTPTEDAQEEMSDFEKWLAELDKKAEESGI